MTSIPPRGVRGTADHVRCLAPPLNPDLWCMTKYPAIDLREHLRRGFGIRRARGPCVVGSCVKKRLPHRISDECDGGDWQQGVRQHTTCDLTSYLVPEVEVA